LLHNTWKGESSQSELEGQPSSKAYQATLDFENPSKTPSSSSIKEGMLELHVEIERLKSLMESIINPPSSTCSLTMTDKNFILLLGSRL